MKRVYSNTRSLPSAVEGDNKRRQKSQNSTSKQVQDIPVIKIEDDDDEIIFIGTHSPKSPSNVENQTPPLKKQLPAESFTSQIPNSSSQGLVEHPLMVQIESSSPRRNLPTQSSTSQFSPSSFEALVNMQSMVQNLSFAFPLPTFSYEGLEEAPSIPQNCIQPPRRELPTQSFASQLPISSYEGLQEVPLMPQNQTQSAGREFPSQSFSSHLPTYSYEGLEEAPSMPQNLFQRPGRELSMQSFASDFPTYSSEGLMETPSIVQNQTQQIKRESSTRSVDFQLPILSSEELVEAPSMEETPSPERELSRKNYTSLSPSCSSNEGTQIVHYSDFHQNRKMSSSARGKKEIVYSDLSPFEPHIDQICAEKRNRNPIRIMDARKIFIYEYSQLSLSGRREYFGREVRQVTRHNELRLFYEEHIRLGRRINEDPTLKNYFNMQLRKLNNYKKRNVQMAIRCLSNYNRNYFNEPDMEKNTEVPLPDELKLYEGKSIHVAPRNRVRITNDIMFSVNTRKLPVYSDVPGETPEIIVIPDSILHDYIVFNIIDKVKETLLADCARISMAEQNQIKCTCASSEPVVNCFDNPDCPCFKMNEKFQKFQLKHGIKEVAKFHTFNPMEFELGDPPFYKHVGYSCSRFCGCNGVCTNNTMFLVEKNLFPMEIYRSDPLIGFGVRSTCYIPAETPVMEFCGEMVDSDNLHRDLYDFSMQLTDYVDDRKLWDFVQKMREWTPDFEDVLKKFSRRQYHIDCKMQGNASRTLNHSCTPNLESVRIFQRSVTPAHMRMVLFTLKDILPGEQLTIDYGELYKDFPKNKCLCGTLSCRNGPHYKILKECKKESIVHSFSHLQKKSFGKYNEDILLADKFYSSEPVEDEREDPNFSFSKGVSQDESNVNTEVVEI